MFRTIAKKTAPVALAATMVMGALAPVEAGPRQRARNAGIIGGVVGALAAGAIIANQRRARPRYVAPQPVYRAPRRPAAHGGGWAGHVARCYAAYRSYDEASDTYQPYGNRARRRCTK